MVWDFSGEEGNSYGGEKTDFWYQMFARPFF